MIQAIDHSSFYVMFGETIVIFLTFFIFQDYSRGDGPGSGPGGGTSIGSGGPGDTVVIGGHGTR